MDASLSYILFRKLSLRQTQSTTFKINKTSFFGISFKNRPPGHGTLIHKAKKKSCPKSDLQIGAKDKSREKSIWERRRKIQGQGGKMADNDCSTFYGLCEHWETKVGGRAVRINDPGPDPADICCYPTPKKSVIFISGC
jgi:hypothetical protein